MLVGLTGGVASGKSLVASELKRLGAHLIDADDVAREITSQGMPAYHAIVREFGAEALLKDGSINRRALGGIVFSDPGKLKRLNAITHPLIREAIEKRIKDIEAGHKNPLIIVDAALLIETGFYKKVSKVIVVYADEALQRERIMKRNNLNGQEAEKRIAAQMPLKEKLKFADYVIYNDLSPEETLCAAREVYGKLRDLCGSV
ncbi:MAG: dephospho-CoA kinase [Deltaproteobacteria bacterium]|mgnify:CR=1 FL=1